MIAGSASEKDHSIDALRGFLINADFGSFDIGVFKHHSTTQRVFDRSRLLEDLLEHEVLVATFFGLDGTPIDTANRAFDLLPVDGLDLDPFRR